MKGQCKYDIPKWTGRVEHVMDYVKEVGNSETPCGGEIKDCSGFGCTECALDSRERVIECVDFIVAQWIKQGAKYED